MSTKTGRRRKELGEFGEWVSAQYVQRTLGWQVHLRNWRCSVGEIDMVAQDRRHLVIVEVRTRSSVRHGTPVESIDLRKVHRLRRVSRHLLAAHPELLRMDGSVRFDVIGLSVHHGIVTHFEHIRNAIVGD